MHIGDSAGDLNMHSNIYYGAQPNALTVLLHFICQYYLTLVEQSVCPIDKNLHTGFVFF